MNRGTFIDHDGRPAVRFERTYTHPVERVWAAVTDPKEMAHWFPSSVAFEPAVGAEITFSGDPHTDDTAGVVLTFDPPRRFAFTWAGDELHLELEPVGDAQCRLILINVLRDRAAAARNAAGWSVCLAELDKQIDGRHADGPRSDAAERWQPYYDTYVAGGMPNGAEVPR